MSSSEDEDADDEKNAVKKCWYGRIVCQFISVRRS